MWPENIDYPIDVQLSFNGTFYDAITKSVRTICESRETTLLRCLSSTIVRFTFLPLQTEKRQVII